MEHSCPHCGKPLPDGASFCPYCAHGLNRRQQLEPPRCVGGILRRAAKALGLLVLAAVVLLGLAQMRKPKTYTGQGSLTYTDRDGTYELVLGDSGSRQDPTAVYTVHTPLEEEHGRFIHLFINEKATGSDVTELFIQNKIVAHRVEVVPDEPTDHGVTLEEPSLVNIINLGCSFQSNVRWTGSSPDVTIRWTLHMKNDDTLCLEQRHIVEPLELRRYTAEDLSMETLGQLQQSINRLSNELPSDVMAEICLPPVEYVGTLNLSGYPIRLYGSRNGDQCTTIRGGIRVKGQGDDANRIADIEFHGPGVGLEVTAPVKVSGCSFQGYETAVATKNCKRVELYDCLLTDNTVGLSLAAQMGENRVEQCRFAGNGTGILLPSGNSVAQVEIINCVLEQNGVNLDNQGGFPLSLTDTAVT